MTFQNLQLNSSVSSGCDTAALHGLHSREFDSCDGTHCQECCESERRADQTLGKCKLSHLSTDLPLQHWLMRSVDVAIQISVWLKFYTSNSQSLFLQAIKGKYSTSKQMRIASISQLKSSVVKDLAKQVTQ